MTETDRSERDRRYRAERSADPEFRRQERERNQRFRAANAEKLTSERRKSGRDRRYRQQLAPGTEAARRARYVHGPNAAEVLAAMWNQQEGCCYLCGGELVQKDAVVDHDHACCPRAKTCDACRRGFACQRCNRLIGAVADDPGLLRLIANNLEAAVRASRARIAAKPVQTEFELPSTDEDESVRIAR